MERPIEQHIVQHTQWSDTHDMTTLGVRVNDYTQRSHNSNQRAPHLSAIICTISGSCISTKTLDAISFERTHTIYPKTTPSANPKRGVVFCVYETAHVTHLAPRIAIDRPKSVVHMMRMMCALFSYTPRTTYMIALAPDKARKDLLDTWNARGVGSSLM